MVISPNDFSLWARLTGNKYPSTPAERAKKGPEVQRFIQNLGKEGMLGGKQEEEQKKKKGLPEKLATGALIAGGVAAGVAAARDPRVQNIARRAGATARDKVGEFLNNFAPAQQVDVDIVNASGDVTPDPRQQQTNVAPQLKSGPESMKPGGFGSRIVGPLPDVSIEDSVDFDIQRSPSDPTYGAYGEDVQLGNVKDIMREQEQLAAFTGETSPGIDPVSGVSYEDIKQKLQNTAAARGVKQPVAVDKFTPLVQGKTYFTEGGVSKEDPYGDISNLEKRVDRTYGKYLNNLKPEDAAKTRESLIRGAAKERDYALGYINAIARGRTDEQAAITGRKFAGYDLNRAVGPQTPFREALSNLKIASPIPLGNVDDLLKLVETGPQIILPEKAQNRADGSGAIVLAGGGNNTNVIPTMGATIGGSSLTDKHATKMAVDNVLDNVRQNIDNRFKEAEEIMGPRPTFPIDDPARQKDLYLNNPLQFEREVDQATKADMAYSDERAYIQEVLDERKRKAAGPIGTPVRISGVRIEGPSNIQKAGPDTVIERNRAGDITGIGDANYRPGQRELPIIYSTDRETNQQMRRIEPTNQQLSDIKQEQGEVATDRFGNMMITSPTYDSITGFKPSTESISTNPLEERISRLEGKTAELRAIQENLSRAGELMSAGLDPRTTRFDSARAAGLTSKSGITPRITNPRFQENMNLGKVQEAALPKPSARAYFEQDSEGRIIPATMEQRSSERRVVKGPDTKTITSGGGYQPRGGVGSSIGAYGIEPTDFAQADITKRPTDTGDKQSFSKRPPSANPVESFDVANELRKIQTDQSISPEERRARSKDFLKQKMSERGISAMGESEPLRKR